MTVSKSRRKQLNREAKAFHRANPQVYTRLVKMARAYQARGHKKAGMRMFYEVLRWQQGMQVVRTDDFKLNDHHAPWYARRIMRKCPDLEGFFEIRGQ